MDGAGNKAAFCVVRWGQGTGGCSHWQRTLKVRELQMPFFGPFSSLPIICICKRALQGWFRALWVSWADVAWCSAAPGNEGERTQCDVQHPPDSTGVPLLRGSTAGMWLHVPGQPWSLLAEVPLPNPGLPLKTCPRASPRHPGLPAPPAAHSGGAVLGVGVCIYTHTWFLKTKTLQTVCTNPLQGDLM